MVRLGFSEIDPTRTKRPESRRTDIVRIEPHNKNSVRQFLIVKKKRLWH
jgi:hypothetical protein